MRTPDDGDEFGKGLGKKVTPPTVENGDEYERFIGQHGDRLMRNKRTGAVESATPRRINVEPKPPPPVDPFEHLMEVIKKAQEQQEEDGYPNIYWGTF